MPGPKLNEAPVRARKTGARGASGHSVKATAKFIRTSPYKVRVVLDLVRGHDVAEAANILRFCERDAAITVGKVLRSAVANAAENDDIPAEELYVSACYCDEGPTIKRFRPRARGRTGAIRKRTSHITVVVSRLPDTLLAQARNTSAQAAASRARRTAGQRATAEQTVADSRRSAAGAVETVAGATMDAPVDATAVETTAVETTAVETTATTALFTAPAGDVDALNKIIGIGPKLAEQLHALGITQFAQLAEMSDDDLTMLDAEIPRSFEQLSDWRTQAGEIVAGTWNRDSSNNT